MQDWISGVFGNSVNPVVGYIVVFLLIILAIYILIRIARKLLGGTYVAGGKSRHLRLAVMDATPVDSHRRLVLVRRDDVEHLILIGGPTDVVVEQNIRIGGQVQSRAEQFAAPATNPDSFIRPEPPKPLAPVLTNPIAQPAPRPYSPPPAPVAPRPIAPPLPAASRPFAPLNPARPVAPPAAPISPVAAVKPAPVTTVQAATATVLATGAVATASSAKDALVSDKPKTNDDSMFSQLSDEIEKAASSEADDISLDKELEGLLENLDTKSDRIG